MHVLLSFLFQLCFRWWTPYGVLKKPDFKKCKIADVASHEGEIKYTKRWFQMEGNELHYYKTNPRDTRKRKIPKPRGTIQMSDILSVRACRAERAPPLSLELVTEHKQYLLVANTQRDYLRWAYKIQEAVNKARGE